MKTIAVILIIVLSFTVCKSQSAYLNKSKEQLIQFSNLQDRLYKQKHNEAIKLTQRHNIPSQILYDKGGGVAALQYFYNDKPVYFITHNINAAATTSADLLWSEYNMGFWLNGDSVEIGLWDGGAVFKAHQEFSTCPEKIWQRDMPVVTLNHATHVSGTINAEGIKAESIGMAPRSQLFAYDFNNNMAEIAIAASENLLLSNHSYGKICGWTYNPSNENWFWYGDASLNTVTDVDFGYYDSLSYNMDFISYYAPNYLIVKSAGNDRGEGPLEQPVDHYEWQDGWFKCDEVHDLDGGLEGYQTVSSMATAKNILVVGSVQDLPQGYQDAESVQIESYSAFGPTLDGRIKPDVVANGSYVYSCVADGDKVYEVYSGTSMSTANATGSIALLLQLQKQLQPDVDLWSSTIKALLIHTADECGTAIGPDYRYGYGLINSYKAAILLKNNVSSGGSLITESIINKGESCEDVIVINEACDELKLTLCWTDPPGNVYDYLNEESNLTNDLDLTLQDETGNIYYPWKLNSNNPNSPAVNGENHIDNVEQIVVKNPLPGNYTIKINGERIHTDVGQSYSLIKQGQTVQQGLQPPVNLFHRVEDCNIRLCWEAPWGAEPSSYLIYQNNQFIGASDDTTYVISNVEEGVEYAFHVSALYNSNIESESLPSNRIIAKRVQQLELPYIANFDEGFQGWEIQHNDYGWRWGTRDSLTSYYLNFDNNETPFLWIDSGLLYESSHVTDIAWLPPVNLNGADNISLSFDYVLVTDRYDVIDDLFVVCRQVGDRNWEKIAELTTISDWSPFAFTIPTKYAKINMQIGFYYDDYYRRGMGAAIDNVSLIADFTTNVETMQVIDYQVQVNNREVYLVSDKNITSSINWSVYDVAGRILNAGGVDIFDGRASFNIGDVGSQIVILKVQDFQNISCFKLYLD
nr:S8 family serine peptidase [uncultured Carboxylicivirga sp.]